MGIFKKIHAVRVVKPGSDHDELLRMLSEAISRGYVEQIPVTKPHPHAPNLSWYQDKKTGQIYSLDPPDQLPGWWTEVHPDDDDFNHLRTAEEGTNGRVNQRKRDVKIFWGLLLLFLTPVFLFVSPVTKTAVLRDLLLVFWWAFIFWLLHRLLTTVILSNARGLRRKVLQVEEEVKLRKLLILICCAVVAGAAQQSVRNVDWRNFSYPLLGTESVPGEVHWMSSVGATETASLVNGEYVPPDCSNDKHRCPLLTFDSVNYGALTGVESTVAIVVLTYHSGGTAHWQYVYLFSLNSGKPQLLAWLSTGSRADQGLRDVSITDGDFILVVNDPDKRQGDCCSAGSIASRYTWTKGSFSEVGKPVYKNDLPSFDCSKAVKPMERMICRDAELSFLDRQMAESYQMVLKSASAERKEIVRRQQVKWFAEYSRACNAALSDEQRRDCIDQHLTERLMTIWK